MPSALTCGITWTENGELCTDGKPAVGIVHLIYRENAAHPSLEVPVCHDHLDQLSSRKSDVGLGARSPEPVHVTVTYTRLLGVTSRSGMEQKETAVQAAVRTPPQTRQAAQITISPGSYTLAPNESFELTATVTGLATTAVVWTAAQGTIIATGLSTAVYTAPNSAAATVDTITASSAVNRCLKATVQVSITASVAVTVIVSPSSANVTAGTGQITFTAVVNGISDQRVTWSVSAGGLGQTGNPAIGSVNAATGVYTPPTSLAVQSFDNVTATSVGYPAASSFSTVTINPNVIVTITPGSAGVMIGAQQQFTAAIAGATNQTVIWTAQLGLITQAGLYTAPTTPGIDKITATSVTVPGALAQVAVTVTTGTGVTVTVTPSDIALNPGQTQQFTAVVNGLTNQTVTWSLEFFNATPKGTISATGLYTAPASNLSPTATDMVVATSVADPAAQGVANINIQIGGTTQLDLLEWMVLSTRTTQHLVGDPSAPYEVQWLDTDSGYPSNYPKNTLWFVKNKLGNPWDVLKYDASAISHWMTENGDSADQAACQAANGTKCWLYSHAYKRKITPVPLLPRMFAPNTTITLDTAAPTPGVRTTNCESTVTNTNLGSVRCITTGPFKISWGGSIDHGTGTGATAPNYDPVNGVDTIRSQYCYTVNASQPTGYADVEETYYVLGFGRVAWYYYHNGAFVQKTVNTTLASGGHPALNFPCGPGKTWFV